MYIRLFEDNTISVKHYFFFYYGTYIVIYLYYIGYNSSFCNNFVIHRYVLGKQNKIEHILLQV